MKALGMDLGTRTLGLATSDRLGMIASPYKTIRYEDINTLVDEVLEIIKNEKIEVLVLGYPKNMNNTEGPAVERTNNFKNLLESKTDLEINLIDERLSTVEAENYLLEEDMSRKNRKGVIDAVAASVILDTYLRQQEIKNRG
jgi:putative Holliday junction resolvase